MKRAVLFLKLQRETRNNSLGTRAKCNGRRSGWFTVFFSDKNAIMSLKIDSYDASKFINTPTASDDGKRYRNALVESKCERERKLFLDFSSRIPSESTTFLIKFHKSRFFLLHDRIKMQMDWVEVFIFWKYHFPVRNVLEFLLATR